MSDTPTYSYRDGKYRKDGEPFDVLSEIVELRGDNQQLRDLRTARDAELATLRPVPIHIVFDGPPGPEAGRFVETETPDGKGVRVGKWMDRGDGLWALEIRIPQVDVHGPN